jgi:MFS family permease
MPHLSGKAVPLTNKGTGTGTGMATGASASAAPSNGTRALWQAWPGWTWGLILASCTVVLDFFVVLACLPAIESTMNASKSELQLILGAYAIANAALLVVGGRAGDVYGRKRTLQLGLGLFALASLGCATAIDPLVLILCRAGQGAAGALMQPQVLGLLSVSFRGAERIRAFDLYATSMGFAAVAAQLIGGAFVGLLTQDFGWRACFWLSVPLCLGSAWLVRRIQEPAADVVAGGAAPCGDALPERNLLEQTRNLGDRIDLVGATLLGTMLASVCAALTVGREQGWPVWALAAMPVAGLCALALWRWQRRGARLGHHRIIPQGILQTNGFGLALLTVGAFYAGVASLYFVIAQELRDKAVLAPLGSAVVFSVMAVSFVWASSSLRLKAWAGARWAEYGLGALAAGHLLLWAASALAMAGQAQATVVAAYAAAILVQGLGVGMLMGQLVGTALARVAPQWASIGGGMASTLQQIGNALGIAGVGLLYLHAPSGQGAAGGSTGGAVAYFFGLLAIVMALRWGAARQKA